MRLMAKRPPSTTGVMPSTTARRRPSPGNEGAGSDLRAAGRAGGVARRDGRAVVVVTASAEAADDLPGILSVLRLEDHHAEWWQRECERMLVAVCCARRRGNAAEVAAAAPAVHVRIAVEELLPEAAARDAHVVAG